MIILINAGKHFRARLGRILVIQVPVSLLLVLNFLTNKKRNQVGSYKLGTYTIIPCEFVAVAILLWSDNNE